MIYPAVVVKNRVNLHQWWQCAQSWRVSDVIGLCVHVFVTSLISVTENTSRDDIIGLCVHVFVTSLISVDQHTPSHQRER